MRIEQFGSAESRIAVCAQCGKEFTRVPSQLAKYSEHFCGRACFADSKYEGKHPRYASGFTPKLTARIRQRDGNACRICGLSSEPKSRKLVVHHIDEQRIDHSDENLITLCRSCHLRVHAGDVRLPA